MSCVCFKTKTQWQELTFKLWENLENCQNTRVKRIKTEMMCDDDDIIKRWLLGFFNDIYLNSDNKQSECLLSLYINAGYGTRRWI